MIKFTVQSFNKTILIALIVFLGSKIFICMCLCIFLILFFLQVIAQFSQTIEVTPCRPNRDDVDVGSLDSSTRSFPHIPDDTDRDSAGRTVTSSRYSSTTTTSSRSGREQRTGGEHMFHQQVSKKPYMCECIPFSYRGGRTALILT